MFKNIFNTILATATAAFTAYFYFGGLMALNILFMPLCYGVNLIFWIIFFCCYPHEQFTEADYDYTIITTTIDLDSGTTSQTVKTRAYQAFSDNFWLNLLLVFLCFATSPVSQIVVIVILSLKHRNVTAKVIAIILALAIIIAPIVGVLAFKLPASYGPAKIDVKMEKTCESWSHSSNPGAHHNVTMQFVYIDGTTKDVTFYSHEAGKQKIDEEDLLEIRIPLSNLEGTKVVDGMTLKDDVYVWRRTYFNANATFVFQMTDK